MIEGLPKEEEEEQSIRETPTHTDLPKEEEQAGMDANPLAPPDSMTGQPQAGMDANALAPPGSMTGQPEAGMDAQALAQLAQSGAKPTLNPDEEHLARRQMKVSTFRSYQDLCTKMQLIAQQLGETNAPSHEHPGKHIVNAAGGLDCYMDHQKMTNIVT